MNISEKRKKELEKLVCIQQLKKAIREKTILGELDLSERTINDYCLEIELFFRQIGIPHDQKPTIEQCYQWRDNHIDQYSKKTMAKKIVAINTYLKLICEYQESIRQIKNITRAKTPVVLSRKQIMDMVSFAESQGKYTEATLIFTGFITACRNGVLWKIKLSDLDFKRNIITFRGCKGDHDLNVPIGKSDMQKIKEYIDKHRPKPKEGHEDYLFILDSKERVYEKKLDSVLRYCAVHCDIKEKVHPHVLRHSRIKDLRNQGYSWEEIMTITGHKNIMSLSSYIHEEGFDKVQEKLNGNHEEIEPEKQKSDNTDMQKELEMLKLKLQLAEKEKEIAEKEKQNLEMQLQLNTRETSIPRLNADQQKGYV